MEEHYQGAFLYFRLNRHPIEGILKGSMTDWTFYSQSPAFLKQVPSGRLKKYALWYDSVPREISKLYNGILESALKAGYPIDEKE